jgi:hypothetical protein
MVEELKALILTVDTEPDDPEWRGLGKMDKAAPALGNLTHLVALVPWMREYGLKPTLLATHSVVCSRLFDVLVGQLIRHGDLEIGMHLHPADSPPYASDRGDAHDNLLLLDEDMLLAKLERMYGEMSSRFDAPRSFRGAAWTVDSRVFRWLAQRGFAVDSSVTSGVDWRLRDRPDWSEAPTHPYRASLSNPERHDQRSPLVEVPPNIWSSRHLPEWTKRIPGMRSLLTQPLRANRSMVLQALRSLRPQEPRWLRPALESKAGMFEVAEAFAASECLHLMIHSNEMAAGASPYARTTEEAMALRERLGAVIERLTLDGWRPMTLTEFAEAWSARHPVASQVAV